jgi:hypothetical protein
LNEQLDVMMWVSVWVLASGTHGSPAQQKVSPVPVAGKPSNLVNGPLRHTLHASSDQAV